MIDVLIIIGISVFLLFALVIVRGAPFVPTLKPQITEALDLLELKSGQVLLELGSGDGRLLRAAAERGIYAVGYELNPLLVVWTKIRHWKYRSYITVKWGDFWQTSWPESDGMYVFLLHRYMDKLDKKVAQYAKKKHYKLVSFGFQMPNHKSKVTRQGLNLYEYNEPVR